MQKKPCGGTFWDADHDSEDGKRATSTLIICSAPRTGSSELCRLLTAAGIGAPNEYFHPFFADRLGPRWQIKGDPLDISNIDAYIEALLTRRSRNGIFATKLQFWQYQRALQHPLGSSFLRDATLVHLYRPDIVRQFHSLRIATITGNWGHDQSGVLGSPQPNTLDSGLDSLDFLTSEDAGLRRLFVLAGKTPLFLTMDDVVERPKQSVERVAQAVGVSPDYTAVENAISLSAPYQKDPRTDRRAREPVEALRQRWLLAGYVKRFENRQAVDETPQNDRVKLEQAIAELQKDNGKLRRDNEKLQRDNAELQRDNEKLQRDNEKLQRDNEKLQKNNAKLGKASELKVNAMKNSMSWRITSPLRRAGRLLRGGGPSRGSSS